MAVSREYSIKVKAKVDPSSINKELAELGKNTTISPQYDGAGAKQAGKDADSNTTKYKNLGDMATSVFKKFNLWYGIAQISHKVYEAIGDVVTNTIALDTAMTGLSKVSNISKENLGDFTAQVGAAGIEIGKTTTQMVDAATVFAQAGFTDEADLEKLAVVAGTFTNIADTEIDTADSASFLIATMKAFNLTADDTTHIIDAVNEVSNNYAVSSGDLATSIGKVASTMSLSGTTFEQTLGLMTGVTEITRDSSKAATGLKTISLRLQGMEEDSDGVAQSVDGLGSKMQDVFSEIGVSLTDENGTMNSFYDNILAIGKAWPTLTEAQKGYYAEQAAGKNQANVFAALMSNVTSSIDATATAYDSAGSAATENAKQMESAQGHIDKLKAAWEQFTTSFGSSDLIKKVADLGTALLNFASTDIGKTVIGLSTLAVGFGVVNAKVESFSAISKVLKTAPLVDKIGDATEKTGLLSKAFSSLTSAPVILGIAGLAATFLALQAAVDKSKGAVAEAQDEMVSQATTAKDKYDENVQSLEDLNAEADGLRSTIETLEGQDELSPVDLNNLQVANDHLILVMQQIRDMQTEIENAKTVSSETTQNALNKKSTISAASNLGSLTGNDYTMQEELDALMKDIADTNAESGDIMGSTAVGVKNTGDIIQVTLENQKEELERVKGKLEEVQSTTEKGSDTYKELGAQIDAANYYLEYAIPLMDSNTAAAEKFGNTDLDIDGKSVQLGEISESINTQVGAFANGEESVSEYFDNMNAGMQYFSDNVNVAGYSIQDMTNMSIEEFESLTDAQKSDVETALAAWNMYQDSVESVMGTTIDNFDLTSETAGEDISAISESLSGLLAQYAQSNGLVQDSSGLWVDSAGNVDGYASSLQTGIDNTNALSVVTDFAATNAANMAQITADGFDSTSAEGQAAIASLNSGIETSFASLKTTNETAWNKIISDITTASPQIASQIIDDNGQMKDNISLSAAEIEELYADIGSSVEDSLDTNTEAVGLLSDKSTEKAALLAENYQAVNDQLANMGIVGDIASGQISDGLAESSDNTVIARKNTNDYSDAIYGTSEAGLKSGEDVAAGAQLGAEGAENSSAKYGLYGSVLDEVSTSGINSGNAVYQGALTGGAGVDSASGKVGILNDKLLASSDSGTTAGNKIESGMSKSSTSTDLATRRVNFLISALDALPTSVTVGVAVNIVKWVQEKITGVDTSDDLYDPTRHAKGSNYIDETQLSWVGENGPELLMLPKGTGVANARETSNFRDMLSGGSGIVSSGNTGNISTKELSESVKEAADSLTKVLHASSSYFGSNKTLQTMGVSTDNSKSEFNSAYSSLQNTDTKGSETYLNKLDSLNKKYFGNKEEYLKDYQKYEMEVYNGRVALEEEAEKTRTDEHETNMKNFVNQFQTQADALDYMLDKNILSEDEYYLQLSKLNDKYFKGKYEYIDEYTEYELKVYDHLKDKEEERIEELSEKTDSEFSKTQKAIVSMIDSQIAAEEDKLDAIDEETDKQEKLKEIEEARQNLAEAYQSKVYVYRSGQGFGYENDAQAIEDAQQALNDLMKDNAIEDQEDAINDEIDRLEDLKDSWSDALDVDETEDKYKALSEWLNAFEYSNYETRLAMAEDFKKSYTSMLEDIANQENNIDNTASINLQNFSVNGYANGSDSVANSGYAIVGENGPELVNIPKGSGIMTANETKRLKALASDNFGGIFSTVSSAISEMKNLNIASNNEKPVFDFSSWNVDVNVEEGLVSAIQNNLEQTVVQYMSKRKK